MKSNSKKIAVIIPAYNESTAIKDVLRAVHHALLARSIDHEIIVVDDRSTDNTARLAHAEKAHVIKHLFNTGQGGAASTGLQYAKTHGFYCAAIIDADGQHDAEDLAEGVIRLQRNNADLLIGSRLINPEGMPRLKQLGNTWLSTITYLLFGVKVTDSQSGLRIFSHTALHSLQWKSNGYEFCSEMLWRAKQKNLIIDEFPIKAIYTPYSMSKGQVNWNAATIIRLLFKQRLATIFS